MTARLAQRTLIAALAAAGIGSAFADGRHSHHHASQALIDARTKIFGIENVDQRTGALPKDKVIFSWLGHITGAISFRGRIIMADTYVARLETTPGRTPFVIQDVVNMKPEAVFIGHGHGDHSYNAAVIAANTGATIYMSPEACGTPQTALTRM